MLYERLHYGRDLLQRLGLVRATASTMEVSFVEVRIVSIDIALARL